MANEHLRASFSLLRFYFLTLLAGQTLNAQTLAQSHTWSETHAFKDLRCYFFFFHALQYIFQRMAVWIWKNSRVCNVLWIKWTKLAARWCYSGKFSPVIFLDHSQTRKFVQSLASDPCENKSLWSNSCPMTSSQKGFPQVENKKPMWEAQGQQSFIIHFGRSDYTVIIYCW